MIPQDPVMLLSFVNLKLRDYYDSIEALCEDLDLDRQELERKLEPLRQDVKALSDGLAQVDEYLNLVRDVQYALNDGITEAKGKCEDRILPDIEKIAAWMEEYASVEIHSLHSECAGHIRRKE